MRSTCGSVLLLALSACAPVAVPLPSLAPTVVAPPIATATATITVTDATPLTAEITRPVAAAAMTVRSPDGGHVAIARSDWTIELRDKGERVAWSREAPGQVSRLVWSADGARLGVETHNGVAIYDTATGERTARLAGNEVTAAKGSLAMRLFPALDRVAMLGVSSDVVVIDLATSALHPLAMTSVAIQGFTPNGELVLERGDVKNLTHALLVVDVERAVVLRSVPALGAGIDRVNDAGYVLLQGQSTSVWNLATGARALLFSDGRTVALGAESALALVEDPRRHRAMKEAYYAPRAHVVDLKSGHTGAVFELRHRRFQDEIRKIEEQQKATARGEPTSRAPTSSP